MVHARLCKLESITSSRVTLHTASPCAAVHTVFTGEMKIISVPAVMGGRKGRKQQGCARQQLSQAAAAQQCTGGANQLCV